MPNEDKIELITPTTYDQAVDRAISSTTFYLNKMGISHKDVPALAFGIAAAFRFLRDEIFKDGDDND